MTERKNTTSPIWIDPDEIPDLSTPEWRAKFAKVMVQRGRPLADSPKVSTTIRLDADVLAAFRAEGAGWQSRINAALRQWVARERRKPEPERGPARPETVTEITAARAAAYPALQPFTAR